MTNIDLLLARLGDMPLDPRLAQIDDAVFAGLDAARQPVLSRAALGSVAGLAMMVGVLANVLPARPAPDAPFGMPSQLAPSSLLGDAQ